MSIVFPSNPSTDDEFVAIGKAWRWDGSRWKRYPYAIIDGGFSNTEQNDPDFLYDGGDA